MGPIGSVERRSGEAHILSGHAVSRGGLSSQFMKQGVPRWVTTDERDRQRAYIVLVEQDMPVRRGWCTASPGASVTTWCSKHGRTR